MVGQHSRFESLFERCSWLGLADPNYVGECIWHGMSGAWATCPRIAYRSEYVYEKW
jgi:hypothetical protein